MQPPACLATRAGITAPYFAAETRVTSGWLCTHGPFSITRRYIAETRVTSGWFARTNGHNIHFGRTWHFAAACSRAQTSACFPNASTACSFCGIIMGVRAAAVGQLYTIEKLG